MPKKGEISEIVDKLLKFSLGAGVLSMGLIAPGSIQALDRPVQKYFKKLDGRQKQRELQRIFRYMKQNGLIKGNYEHGLQITEKGRQRIEKVDIEQLYIKRPKKWDKKWRVVLYDVPEDNKTGRDALTRKLKEMNFYQLQKSVWVYPFECRKEIESIAAIFEVDRYVTFLETSYIDKQEILQERFGVN